MSKWPEHKSPQSTPATAPYNFVPLPDQVVTVEKPPDQDQYHTEDRYTGYIDCGLVTLTPLYTRCMMSLDFFAEHGDKAFYDLEEPQRTERARFFNLGNIEKPAIPGSSLRGMVRTLVEIASYSKIQPVTDRKLFFRTVEASSLGKYYRKRMLNKVKTGFLQRRGQEYVIKECQLARVPHDLIGGKDQLYETRGQNEQNKTPRWSASQYSPYHQRQQVWVSASPIKNSSHKRVGHIQTNPDKNLIEGRLVITGDVPINDPKKQKKKEFVFLLPDNNAREIAVDETHLQRFEDEDQITAWQELAFPKNKPESDARQKDGFLPKDLSGVGEPVFFLEEQGQLTFFGRAYMFRLPYENSPRDFVPLELSRESDIDLAEAIFGFVRDKKVSEQMLQTLAGRVFFSDAVYQSDLEGIWCNNARSAKDEANIITPKILGTPNPTSFQHYLVQPNPNNISNLKHYGDRTPKDTVIRGHKLYWHKKTTLGDIQEDSDKKDTAASKVHTRIQPVKEKVAFTFKVQFENLSEAELGALLWALDLPEGYHHKLGMGKPYGLGSVAIIPSLYLSNRQQRYKQLFTEGNQAWESGVLAEPEPDDKIATLKRDFETFMIQQLGLPKESSLSDQPRMKALLALLQADPTPDRSLVAYIDDIQEFKNRRVLPTPQHILESNQLESWSNTNEMEALLTPQTFEYEVDAAVEGRITVTEWPGGNNVRVELTNGETGYLKVATKRFKKIRNRKSIKMIVTDITPRGYELKLDS